MRKTTVRVLNTVLAIIILGFAAVQSKPYLAPYFTRQGLLLAERHLSEEAMLFLNIATFLDSRQERVHYALGKIYQEKKLYRQATDELKSTLRINPGFTEARVLLGQTYRQIKQYDLSLRELEIALNLESYNRLIARLIEEVKKEYLAEQINKAAVFYSRDDIIKTKSTLKKAFELSNNASYNLFITENQQPPENNIETKIDNLELLSEVSSERPLTNKIIANSFMEYRDFKRAIEYYKKSLAGEPNNSVLRNNLAVAFFLMGRFPEAIDEFRAALSFDPSDHNIVYGLARSYQETRLFKEAENLYRYLLKDSSSDMPYIYINLGFIDKEKGDFEAAKNNLEKAMDLCEEKLVNDKTNQAAQLTLKKAREEIMLLPKGLKEQEKTAGQ